MVSGRRKEQLYGELEVEGKSISGRSNSRCKGGVVKVQCV